VVHVLTMKREYRNISIVSTVLCYISIS
jgi:hypothetical protein